MCKLATSAMIQAEPQSIHGQLTNNVTTTSTSNDGIHHGISESNFHHFSSSDDDELEEPKEVGTPDLSDHEQ